MSMRVMVSRGATGIAGALALLVSAVPAFAVCPAANEYSYSYTTATAATLSYASSYSYTGTNTLGQTQNFSVAFTTNGTSGTTINGNQMPAITTLINDGGTTNRNLMIGGTFAGRTASIAGATNVIVTTFTFATPIRDFTIQLNDIDFGANQYRDWIQVTGVSGANTYNPSITTPFTNNNGSGPRTDVNSTLTLGPAGAPYNPTVSQGVGTSTSANNANNGTITASFAQPVTSVSIRYGNYPFTGTETITGQQAYGIQRVAWCPMPALTVVKSSTPVVTTVTDPSRFNIPGSDAYYAITVANANTSPVDVNAINLVDILPAQMTFLNGDIDGAGPLTGNFEFLPGTSGLTLAAGNIAYSNTAGATYAYTPAAGYDANVTAVRFNPQGTMAANSSFTVRFRMRIK